MNSNSASDHSRGRTLLRGAAAGSRGPDPHAPQRRVRSPPRRTTARERQRAPRSSAGSRDRACPCSPRMSAGERAERPPLGHHPDAPDREVEDLLADPVRNEEGPGAVSSARRKRTSPSRAGSRRPRSSVAIDIPIGWRRARHEAGSCSSAGPCRTMGKGRTPSPREPDVTDQAKERAGTDDTRTVTGVNDTSASSPSVAGDLVGRVLGVCRLDAVLAAARPAPSSGHAARAAEVGGGKGPEPHPVPRQEARGPVPPGGPRGGGHRARQHRHRARRRAGAGDLLHRHAVDRRRVPPRPAAPGETPRSGRGRADRARRGAGPCRGPQEGIVHRDGEARAT